MWMKGWCALDARRLKETGARRKAKRSLNRQPACSKTNHHIQELLQSTMPTINFDKLCICATLGIDLRTAFPMSKWHPEPTTRNYPNSQSSRIANAWMQILRYTSSVLSGRYQTQLTNKRWFSIDQKSTQTPATPKPRPFVISDKVRSSLDQV